MAIRDLAALGLAILPFAMACGAAPDESTGSGEDAVTCPACQAPRPILTAVQPPPPPPPPPPVAPSPYDPTYVTSSLLPTLHPHCVVGTPPPQGMPIDTALRGHGFDCTLGMTYSSGEILESGKPQSPLENVTVCKDTPELQAFIAGTALTLLPTYAEDKCLREAQPPPQPDQPGYVYVINFDGAGMYPDPPNGPHKGPSCPGGCLITPFPPHH